MMRALLLVVIGLVGAGYARGQTLQHWLRWGDAAAAAGDYDSACRYYEGALDVAPGRMAVQWSLANAYRQVRRCDQAAALYDRVFFKDQGRTYPDALRWLGEMQLCAGQRTAATKTWQRVLRSTKDPVVKERANNALQGIALSERFTQRADSVTLEALPSPINTEVSEFSPRIGPDGALYFTSLRASTSSDGEVLDTTNYGTRLLRSTLLNGTWSGPEHVLPERPQGDVANSAWSIDGTRLFFTHCASPDSCRIHVAERQGGHWSIRSLEGLGAGTSTQPCVVDWDGREMLLFVSDAPGSAGGTDIWQARLEGGRAVELQPLSGGVNTAGNERCPWYDVRRNELWFSSDHLPGLGGYDLFIARYENDEFSQPINPGTPFNSPQNDLYPFIDPRSGEGWLSSDRGANKSEENDHCCSDLYHWTQPVVLPADSAITASDQGSFAVQTLLGLRDALPLSLYFHNDEPGPRSTARSTELTYTETLAGYTAQLPTYKLQGPDTAAFSSFWKNTVLRGASDLQRLVEAVFPVLEQGRSVVLEVRGHASPLALNDYNARLSERRIASLRNELQEVLKGALLPYLQGNASNGAVLELRSLPFGEEEAERTVSDRLQDLSGSVYSVAAARERRIDVLGIDVAADVQQVDSVLRQVKELGAIRQDQPQRIVFRVQNPGDVPLRLVDSDADCGCTTAVLPTLPIAPGASTELVIDFSGRAPQGPLSRRVRIITDGTPRVLELNITGTVIP